MISVIIPLYNKEKSIARCVKSVLSQTFSDWELIIVDDGSTDKSASVVHPLLQDKRIKYFAKENGGVSSARNYGIKRANGEWIVFIDADDYFLPEALETSLHTALTYHTNIACGNFYQEKDGKRHPAVCGFKKGVLRNVFSAWYLQQAIPRQGSCIYKAELLKMHLYDESLNRYEDMKLLFEIFRSNAMAHHPKFVMVYSQDNLGLSKRSSDFSKDYISCMDFEGKSFWEKMILGDLLRQGLRLYPEQHDFIKSRYHGYLKWAVYDKYMHVLLRVFLKCQRLLSKRY